MHESAPGGSVGGRPNEDSGKGFSSPAKVGSKPRVLSGFVPGGMRVGSSGRFLPVPKEHLTWEANDGVGADDAGTLSYGEKPKSEPGFVNLTIPSQPGPMEIRGGMHPASDGSESSK